MPRGALVVLLTITLLMSVPLTSRAQDASPIPAGGAATPVSSVEITREELARISLPAGAIPPPPAIVDVWLWSLRPGEALAFAAGETPPSIAADVALGGEYTVQSAGRLRVQRDAEIEDVPPGAVVTIRPGDAVIYVDNQVAQSMRNAGEATVRVLSFGVFSAAPPSPLTIGPLGTEDWERSGLAGHDLTVVVERLTLPPGTNLPPYAPDVRAPRFFAVEEGRVQWTIVPTEAATPSRAIPFRLGEVIWFQALGAGEQLQLGNDADRPLVLLQVTVSADRPGTAEATPTL